MNNTSGIGSKIYVTYFLGNLYMFEIAGCSNQSTQAFTLILGIQNLMLSLKRLRFFIEFLARETKFLLQDGKGHLYHADSDITLLLQV